MASRDERASQRATGARPQAAVIVLGDEGDPVAVSAGCAQEIAGRWQLGGFELEVVEMALETVLPALVAAGCGRTIVALSFAGGELRLRLEQVGPPCDPLSGDGSDECSAINRAALEMLRASVAVLEATRSGEANVVEVVTCPRPRSPAPA